MIIKSLVAGFRQLWLHKKMVLIYYAVNLLFGLLLMLPFRFVLSSYVGDSLMGERLAGRLDMDFLFEFIENNAAGFASFKILLLVVPILYWLVALWLSGGVLSVFASGEKFRAELFWGGAAKYFGRFNRLVLWCLPALLLFFLLPLLWQAAQRLFFGSDPYEYVTYWGAWIKVGLRYLAIIFIALILDYARIDVVLKQNTRMRYSAWAGLKFAFGNFWQTFGLALLFLGIGWIVLVVYNLLADWLHLPTTLIIILLFLVQQGYMLSRMVLKLTKFSSQLHLYQSLSK